MNIIEQENRTYRATVAGEELLLALFAMERIRADLELDPFNKDVSFPDIVATVDQLEANLPFVASLIISDEGVCIRAIHRTAADTFSQQVDAGFLAIGLEEIMPSLDTATEQPLARQMIQQIQVAGVEYK